MARPRGARTPGPSADLAGTQTRYPDAFALPDTPWRTLPGGIPAIGEYTVPPIKPVSCEFLLRRAVVVIGGRNCAGTSQAGVRAKLVVSSAGIEHFEETPTGELVRGGMHVVLPAAAMKRAKVVVDRWPQDEGSNVMACFIATAKGQGTAVIAHLDVRDACGFDPAQLELVKLLIRSWQQRNPLLHIDLPLTRALAIPFEGQSLACVVHIPPNYDPQDSSTWVAPFIDLPPPCRRETLSSAAPSTPQLDAPHQTKRRRTSAAVREEEHSPAFVPVPAVDPAPVGPEVQDLAERLERGEVVYSERGRPKRRTTLGESNYQRMLEAEFPGDEDEDEYAAPGAASRSPPKTSRARKRSASMSTPPAATSLPKRSRTSTASLPAPHGALPPLPVPPAQPDPSAAALTPGPTHTPTLADVLRRLAASEARTAELAARVDELEGAVSREGAHRTRVEDEMALLKDAVEELQAQLA